MRRTVRILALLVLLTVLGTVAVAAPAGATDDADEWQFVTLINQARADAGLAPLGVLSAVRDVARGWSAQMGRENVLYHNPNLAAQVGGAVPGWSRIGENVGKGYDVPGLHQAFMNSAGHRANILGDYNYVAVGVVHVNGITWVTENFAKASAGRATISPAPAPAPPPPPPPIPVDRIAGPSDGDTSVAVAGRFPDGGSDAVVVGRSDVFADALAGGPLAAVNNGPVLLTSPSSASSAALAEARRVLKPGGTVYLLGGTTALSPAVEAAFAGAGLRTERIAGADRFDTAVQVARRVNPNPADIIIVSGTNFADAMVTGPVAALQKAPLVLSAPTGLPPISASYLAGAPTAHRTVIGGVAAVPETALAAAGTVDRIAGADRYETAVKVAQRFFPSVDQLSFATGVAFQDALAGAAFSARSGIPLVLVSPSPTTETRSYVRSQVGQLAGSIVYGTANAVPDSAVSQLFV